MLAERWDAAKNLHPARVLDDETTRAQRVEHECEVAFIVGKTLDFQSARAPLESAIPVRDRPERNERQPEWETARPFGIEQVFMLEKLRLDRADAWHSHALLFSA